MNILKKINAIRSKIVEGEIGICPISVVNDSSTIPWNPNHSVIKMGNCSCTGNCGGNYHLVNDCRCTGGCGSSNGHK